MVKIALCDDEAAETERLLALFDKYGSQKDKKINTEVFNSPLDLIDRIEKGTRFDVLLLDVLMPGFNGIQTAAEIRRLDSCVKIIFLTSSSDYAVDSYTVNAYYYKLKPIDEEAFFPLMDSVLETCEREGTEGLILHCKEGIPLVETGKIEYCEIIHRTLFIHLISGKVLQSTGSMDNLEKQLREQGCFLRFHRSYLVNLNHIKSISKKAVTMSSLAEIPIPRNKYNEIKDAFLENAFCKGKTDICLK